MFCGKCQKDLSECCCDDLKERLQDAVDGGHFVYRYCKKCDQHYAKCKCEDPEWAIKDKK